MKKITSIIFILFTQYCFATTQVDFKSYCKNHEKIESEYYRKVVFGLKFFRFEQRLTYLNKMINKNCKFPEASGPVTVMTKENFLKVVKGGLKDQEKYLSNSIKRRLNRSMPIAEQT